MKSIWETPFIVVDIETSGSNSTANRIMDIACVISIGGEITNVFSSLINPHEPIPPFVSKMTGITDEMTYYAPEAKEVFPRIADLFYYKNAVFVAHNARFDWSFIVETFDRLGYTKPTIPRLCTLKLSRRVLPKKIKKNLDELSKYLNINIKNRHRASGDAIATAHILNELLEMSESEHGIYTTDQLLKFQNKPIRNLRIPASSKKVFEDRLDDLPDFPGVFSLLDDNANVLFISKAKSLRNKINSYIRGEVMTSKSLAQMFKITDKIIWTTTNSELSAGILETHYIKELNPPYNAAKTLNRNFPYIKLTINDEYPFLEITFTVNDDGNLYFGPFKNVQLAYQIIRAAEKKHKIRKCDFKLEPSIDNRPCYYFYADQCNAPCAMKTTKSQYNEEVQKVINFLEHQPVDTIRQLEEQVLKIQDNSDGRKKQKLNEQVATLKNLFDSRYRRTPESVKGNLVFIHPVSQREKLAEFIILKNGKTILNKLVGSRTDLQKILNRISKEFFGNGQQDEAGIGEDYHIINKYHQRHKDNTILLHSDGKTKSDYLNEIINSFRSLNYSHLK